MTSHQTLKLTTPPLHLTDRIGRLTLSFTASLTLSIPPSIPLDLWRTALLLPAHHLPLRLSATHNSLPLPDSWPKSISSAPMWSQLSLSAALCTAPLTVTLSSPPLQVPITGAGRVVGIDMEFEFSGPGAEVMALTDVALRGFWADKVAGLVPVLGKVGVREECEKRQKLVEIVAGLLEKECKRDSEAVQADVWRAVVGNLRQRGRLKVVESVGSVGSGEGMLEEEEEEVELMMVEDSDVENMLEDSKDGDFLVESDGDVDWDWGLDVDEIGYSEDNESGHNWEDFMAVDW